MNRTRRDRIAAAVGVAAVAAVAAGIGWVLAGTGDARRDDLASAPAVDSSSPPAAVGSGATPAPSADGGPQGGGDPPAGGGNAGGEPGEGDSEQPGDPVAGPRIELFQVAQEPRCPAGTSEFPVDGRPAQLEWRVTGADEVTISIDGPGVYATYPEEGGDSYGFGCGGSEGDIEEHTYLLTATGGGVTVTDTLVVSAVVHERPEV